MESSIQAPAASGTTTAAATASNLAAAPSSQPHVSFDMMMAGDAATSPSDSDQHKRIEGQLQSLLSSLQEREPLDASYESLLPASFRKHAKACVTISKAGGSSSSQKSSQSGGGDSKQQNKKSNILPADVKLHRRLNANLRGIVEKYASTPAGWRRKPNTRRIDVDFGSSQSEKAAGGDATTTSTRNNNDAKIESMLRAAFALRESKEHEQRDLVNATLKAENSKLYRSWGYTPEGWAGMGMGGAPPMMGLPPFEEVSIRKKRLDGIVKQLRDKEKGASERAKWTRIAAKGKELILHPESTAKAILSEFQPPSPPHITSNAATPDPRSASLGGKRKRAVFVDPERDRLDQIEEARKREKVLRDRLEREDAENKRQMIKEREEAERRERALETPRDALKRLYEPIFTALWDMEFASLGNTNPFRMVIDKSTCADMGLHDYCDVIKKPMNLTYIQTKVNNKSYETLQEFLEDVDLIAKNALQYNVIPSDPYHIAAKEFRRKFRKMAKPLVQSLTKGMATEK